MNQIAEPVPRINGEIMKRFVTQYVRLIGKVISTDETTKTAEIEASDGIRVVIHTSGNYPYTSLYMEVFGQVLNDMSIQEFTAVPFGSNFDLANYNKMLQLTYGKFSDLFI